MSNIQFVSACQNYIDAKGLNKEDYDLTVKDLQLLSLWVCDWYESQPQGILNMALHDKIYAIEEKLNVAIKTIELCQNELAKHGKFICIGGGGGGSGIKIKGYKD